MTEPLSLPYRPRERKLYRYWDGLKKIREDPMVLSLRLHEVEGDLAAELRIAAFPNYPAAPEAHTGAIGNIQKVFNLLPFEKGGLAEAECMSLLHHFIAYFQGIRRRYEPLSDQTGGDVGQLRLFLGRKPSYEAFYGMWLNRDRSYYRTANAVALGAGVALGSIDPGEGFFRAIANSEVEAKSLRGQYLAARGSSSHLGNGVNHGG